MILFMHNHFQAHNKPLHLLINVRWSKSGILYFPEMPNRNLIALALKQKVISYILFIKKIMLLCYIFMYTGLTSRSIPL
jgi:hypothetical protein